MTKKMRKVPKEPSAPASCYANDRHRIKYQTLLQDYMELHKEIELKMLKVQEAREKKLQLLAVVRYLRRKYKKLSENPYQEMPIRLQQPSHSTRTPSLSGRVAHSVNLLVPNRESSKKKYRLSKTTNTRTSVTDSLSAPQYKFKKQSRRNSSRHPQSSDMFITRDLVSQDESYQLKEAANTGTSPVQDPHQVSLMSGEEMDFQLKRFSMNAVGSNDAEITISRHLGKNKNKVGKRKISWQDQIALKV